MFIVETGSPCLPESSSQCLFWIRQSMSTLERGSPFLFLKQGSPRLTEYGNTCLQTCSPYSKDLQSMSILEAGSSCLLESGSLCLFWIKAVNVYSWERQSINILKAGQSTSFGIRQYMSTVFWRQAPFSKDMQSMSILVAGSPCLLESGSLCLLLDKQSIPIQEEAVIPLFCKSRYSQVLFWENCALW